MNMLKEIIFVFKHWNEIVTPIDVLLGKNNIFKIGDFPITKNGESEDNQ